MIKVNNKIKNDKYYTATDLAQYVVDKTKEVIGIDNITQYLEPSAGSGVFLPFLSDDFLAYDIEPEGENIVQADYLKLELDYMEGRLIIGNPPFGSKGNLVRQFYNKSIELGDYIAFILPISQWNNNVSLYKFDLIYSENLGKRIYSDREVHCCFNIYRRPNMENGRPKYELDGIEIKEHRRDHKRNAIVEGGEDYRIKSWGGNCCTIGQRSELDKYAREFCFFIRPDYKDRVIKALQDVEWCELYPMTRNPTLNKWQVLKYLGDTFPELKKKVVLNSRPTYELDGVEVKIWYKDCTKKPIENADYTIIGWGRRIGIETETPNTYINELAFFINPDIKYKVIKVLKETKWREIYPNEAFGSLLKWQVLKYLGQCFPELKK